MGYDKAIDKAWNDIKTLSEDPLISVSFLSDKYEINTSNRTIFSASCNIPAKDHYAIIILHYMAAKLKLKTLPEPAGEWIDFNQIAGGEGYYPAFKKRTIAHIIQKYGSKPESLNESCGRFNCRKADVGDVSLIVYPFEKVPILIALSKPDDEFGPDANILFDKNINKIFCTEDIVVMTEILTHLI